jgi:hypothetical protein
MTSRMIVAAIGIAGGLAALVADVGSTAYAAPASKAPPKITAAWLIGDWGYKGNGRATSDCEETAVTFSKGGKYSDDETRGRYRTDGRRIIYYDRVEFGEEETADGTPNFIESLVTPVTALSNRSFRERGQLLIRCGR